MGQMLCKALGMQTLRSPVPALAMLTDKLNAILTVPKTIDTKKWSPQVLQQMHRVAQNI